MIPREHGREDAAALAQISINPSNLSSINMRGDNEKLIYFSTLKKTQQTALVCSQIQHQCLGYKHTHTHRRCMHHVALTRRRDFSIFSRWSPRFCMISMPTACVSVAMLHREPWRHHQPKPITKTVGRPLKAVRVR